jgi:hypothetical protein
MNLARTTIRPNLQLSKSEFTSQEPKTVTPKVGLFPADLLGFNENKVASLSYINLCPESVKSVPPFMLMSTETCPASLAGGTMQANNVDEIHLILSKEACRLPKTHQIPPSKKPLPLILTMVPPKIGPMDGLTLDTTNCSYMNIASTPALATHSIPEVTHKSTIFPPMSPGAFGDLQDTDPFTHFPAVDTGPKWHTKSGE